MLALWRNRWSRIAVCILLLTLLAWCGLRWWVGRLLIRAEERTAAREWSAARDSLRSYLQYSPRDSKALLMLAEAYIRDNRLNGSDKVNAALEQLARIPDSDHRAAEARLQEGRLYLLLLIQPGRAERAFLKAAHLDPTRTETQFLLWKLYDLTNRWDLAEPYVWQLHEQLPPREKAIRLRDWYLSEFSPGTANLELERRLGLLAESEFPDEKSEHRRLEAFVVMEPDWPTGHAILARWIYRQGNLEQAGHELGLAEQLPGGAQEPLVIATRVAICLELGEFDRALQAFHGWPAPHEGYEYWKTAGLIADQVTRDFPQARDYYFQAIQTTAGKSDWLTQHRLVQCLTRLGETDQAAKLRLHSKEVELLMENTAQIQIRRALSNVLSPDTIGRMVNLYQHLGREREVLAWKQLTNGSEEANLVPVTDNLESVGRVKVVPAESK